MKWYDIKKYRALSGEYLILDNYGKIIHVHTDNDFDGDFFECKITAEKYGYSNITHFCLIEPISLDV
jgi:hypothetical protein